MFDTQIIDYCTEEGEMQRLNKLNKVVRFDIESRWTLRFSWSHFVSIRHLSVVPVATSALVFTFVFAIFFLAVTMYLLLVPLLISQVVGLAIEAKLDLPDPTSLIGPNGQLVALDSSLSPKIVKAFYEISFVPTSKPDRNKQFVSVSGSKGCPYSTDFCKFYFVPTKVSTVQKVDDMIEEAKKDSEIPVIEGLSVPDEEKLLRELNETIMAKVNKVVSLKKNQSGDVPVYRGTVNVEQVLKSHEISSLPDYKPNWPEIKKNPCFQGPCNWRNPYQRSTPINIHLQ